MAALQKKKTNENEMTEERKQEVLSKFKNILIAAARKQRLQKLIETKRREQGIDIKEDNNDSPFVPCSDDCITKFLEITEPNKDDIIVDIGCGDARLLIAAAQKTKCKCIGIEIQPKVIEKAKQNVIKNNLTDYVEIIECDFKSIECQKILKTATIIFIFLLPKIMPLITNILSKSVQNGCRVVSYIFDLSRIHKEKKHKNKKIVEINKWSYPSLGSTKIEYIETTNNVFLNDVHPDLIKQVKGEKYGKYRLLKVNGKKIDDIINNLYDFIVFKRYLHDILTNYYQHRYIKDDNNKYPFSLIIEYYELNDICDNMKDLEAVKPKLITEVVKKFKNGSEMRSDLKLYQFPLNESDFGWINPNGASRIVHAS